MNKTWKSLVVSALIFTTLLSFEHYFRHSDNYFRPSYSLNKIATLLENFFEQLGGLCAWASSYLTMLKFDELLESFDRLAEPMIRILFSMYYFNIGYLDYILDISRPYLVFIGSSFIFLIVSGIIKCYNRKFYNIYMKCITVMFLLLLISYYCYPLIHNLNWSIREYLTLVHNKLRHKYMFRPS